MNGSRYEDIYETDVLKFLRDFNTGMILYKIKTVHLGESSIPWTSPWLSPDRQTVINKDCK